MSSYLRVTNFIYKTAEAAGAAAAALAEAVAAAAESAAAAERTAIMSCFSR